MTKEELEKEAENWLRKYLLCCNCEKKCNCIDSNSYCEEQVLKAYVDSAEPREKRIADLEDKLKKETAQRIYNFNKSIEWKERHRKLEAQIEKMKCCSNCAFQLVIGGVRDRHCVKCNACSEWELED